MKIQISLQIPSKLFTNIDKSGIRWYLVGVGWPSDGAG